jgi:sialate O-acetylesterase
VLAREIATATGVPIGLMQNAMGGTCIEAWTPQDYFNYPLGKKIVADYYLLRKTWSGQDKTGKPQDEPSILYNSLMHPFTKFGIKGFYWWQGEHNTNTWDYDLKNGDNYRYVLPIFIKAMREKFSNAAKDFPVMIMQIHPYGNTTQLGQSELAHVRAGQWHASMTVPNVGVSVSHDIQPTGTETIHPSNREKYAMRAANVVLGKWYGKANPTQPSGMVSTTITGSKAIIECTAGLKLKTKDGQAPKMFVLMDNAGKMHSATATLVGDTKIEVSANGVSSIKEVRYAFSDIPSTNLVNSNDIPLSTFRFIVGETEPTVSNSIPRSKKKLELARPAAGNIYYQLNGRLVHGSVVQSSKHSFSSGFFVNKSSTSFVLMRSGE